MNITYCNNCPQAPVNQPHQDSVPAEHIYTSMTPKNMSFSRTYASEEELKKVLRESLLCLDSTTDELFDFNGDIPDPVVYLCTVEDIPEDKAFDLFMSYFKEDYDDVKEDIPSYTLADVHSLIDRVLDGVKDTIEATYLEGFEDEAEIKFSEELYNKLADGIMKDDTSSVYDFAKSISIWPSSLATPYCKFNVETEEIIQL